MSVQGARVGDAAYPAPSWGLWCGRALDAIRRAITVLRYRYGVMRQAEYRLVDPFAGRYWLIPRCDAQAWRNHTR